MGWQVGVGWMLVLPLEEIIVGGYQSVDVEEVSEEAEV
jgi:hypothetical protein